MAASQSLPPGPFLVVVVRGGERWLCFCSNGSGSGSPRLHVTNTCELWSCAIAPDEPDGQDGLGSSSDCLATVRAAFERQTPTLSVHDSKAILQFQDGGSGLTFDLFKVPLSEARKQLQDLMFGLVERIHKLEKRLEAAEVISAPSQESPSKSTLRSQRLFAPELSPLKSWTGAATGQAATKRRLPGESLINPGFKSKKIPAGVDFEES